MSFKNAIKVGMSTCAFKLAKAVEHHASNSFCRGVFFAEFSRNICATFASSFAVFTLFLWATSTLLFIFFFLFDWLVLLSPGGGAASSQKPPELLLEFIAELQGAGEFETRLEDVPPP